MPLQETQPFYMGKGAQGRELKPKLTGRFLAGDPPIRVDEISIERISPYQYTVQRGYMRWTVTGQSEYWAAVRAVDSLNCPPPEDAINILEIPPEQMALF